MREFCQERSKRHPYQNTGKKWKMPRADQKITSQNIAVEEVKNGRICGGV
jgi:hypothetical protein